MSDLTAEVVRTLLDYDPDTGDFVWRVSPGPRTKAGTKAGRRDARGYWGINIRYRKYASHRLAWLYVHGHWPKNNIDHINRDPSDNRIANLRDVSQSANCRNRGHTAGVSFHKKCQKWQAQICVERQPPKYLGIFNTWAEARAAYEAAARAML